MTRCGGSGYKPISPFDEERIKHGRAIPCVGCEECPCPDCEGKGTRNAVHVRTAIPVKVYCPDCHGTGKAKPKETK